MSATIRDPRAPFMNLAELSDDEFRQFCALIYRVAGIRIADTKRVLVTNRVRRRLRETGIATFSAYYAHLTSAAGSAEMPKFLDAITTNETYFFRDPQHYDWFGETFLPEIAALGAKHQHPRSLRVWSAACSTGEEPYSIALRLLAKKALFPNWNLFVLGTDLSGAVLSTARAASYDDRAVHLVHPDDRTRYFQRDEAARRWSLKPEVKQLVTYRLHNLMLPMSEGQFDCIFLKNVLIYFDKASKEAVVKNIVAAMAKGAYLVIGPTEGIHTMLDPLVKLKPWLFRRPA